MARHRYATFILEGIKQGRRANLYKAQASGRILGEDHFIERVLNEAEESTGKDVILDNIVAAVCNVFDIHEDALVALGHKQKLSRIRGVIGLLVQEIGDALDKAG